MHYQRCGKRFIKYDLIKNSEICKTSFQINVLWEIMGEMSDYSKCLKFNENELENNFYKISFSNNRESLRFP